MFCVHLYCSVYTCSAVYTYCLQWTLTVCSVHLLFAVYTYGVQCILTVCSEHLLCAVYTCCVQCAVYSIPLLCELYPCSVHFFSVQWSLSVCSLHLLCAEYTFCVYFIRSVHCTLAMCIFQSSHKVFSVHMQFAVYTYRVQCTLTVCSGYLLCPWCASYLGKLPADMRKYDTMNGVKLKILWDNKKQSNFKYRLFTDLGYIGLP